MNEQSLQKLRIQFTSVEQTNEELFRFTQIKEDLKWDKTNNKCYEQESTKPLHLKTLARGRGCPEAQVFVIDN